MNVTLRAGVEKDTTKNTKENAATAGPAVGPVPTGRLQTLLPYLTNVTLRVGGERDTTKNTKSTKDNAASAEPAVGPVPTGRLHSLRPHQNARRVGNLMMPQQLMLAAFAPISDVFRALL